VWNIIQIWRSLSRPDPINEIDITIAALEGYLQSIHIFPTPVQLPYHHTIIRRHLKNVEVALKKLYNGVYGWTWMQRRAMANVPLEGTHEALQYLLLPIRWTRIHRAAYKLLEIGQLVLAYGDAESSRGAANNGMYYYFPALTSEVNIAVEHKAKI
jgi:hypothetical protein